MSAIYKLSKLPNVAKGSAMEREEAESQAYQPWREQPQFHGRPTLAVQRRQGLRGTSEEGSYISSKGH